MLTPRPQRDSRCENVVDYYGFGPDAGRGRDVATRGCLIFDVEFLIICTRKLRQGGISEAASLGEQIWRLSTGVLGETALARFCGGNVRMCEGGGRADKAIDLAPMSTGLSGEKLQATSGKAQRDRGRVDMAVGVGSKVVGQVLADEDLFHVKGIGDEHPAFIPKSLADLGDGFLVVLEGARNGHALHVPCGESVDEGFLLVDRIAKAASDEISQTDAEGVALGLGGKAEGGDRLYRRLGEILVAVDATPPDDIGVHPCAAEGFADFIDDEDVEVVAWEGRKVVSMPF